MVLIKNPLTRYDTFTLRQHPKAAECLLVCGNDILRSAGVLQPGMLRSNAWVVEPSADGVCFYDLPCRRLENICPDAV